MAPHDRAREALEGSVRAPGPVGALLPKRIRAVRVVLAAAIRADSARVAIGRVGPVEPAASVVELRHRVGEEVAIRCRCAVRSVSVSGGSRAVAVTYAQHPAARRERADQRERKKQCPPGHGDRIAGKPEEARAERARPARATHCIVHPP